MSSSMTLRLASCSACVLLMRSPWLPQTLPRELRHHDSDGSNVARAVATNVSSLHSHSVSIWIQLIEALGAFSGTRPLKSSFVSLRSGDHWISRDHWTSL